MTELAGGRLRLDHPAARVARLTIANPAKRNALDHAILDAIAATVPALDHRCVIVTGVDRMFCAGYDLGSLEGDAFVEAAEALIAHPFTAAIEALDAYPYPTIAAIGGPAIGGGLELSLACDLRIAARGVRLGMPPAKLGLVYPYTGLQKFVQVIGPARTRELFLVGRYVDAGTAERWGLVNEVVEFDALSRTASERAEAIIEHAPLSLTGNKRVLRAVLAAADQLDPELAQELLELRQACFRSEDFREGVSAWAEKRPARWVGR